MSLLIKNKSYNNVRLQIIGDEGADEKIYYTEASGNRYFFTDLVANVPSMESATFESFLTFTQSGAVTNTYELIPMNSGETVMIETKAVAINASGSKAYLMKSFGGFRHDGSGISTIGGTIDYQVKTDFGGGFNATFSPNGTQSVNLTVVGEAGETVDWDIHLNYTKGFHAISQDPEDVCNTPDCKPIYPPSRKIDSLQGG